jgi:hypothetical protein
MPSFNLPDATIARLVALIRMLDLNRMQQRAAAAATSQWSAHGERRTAPRMPRRPRERRVGPQRVGR